MILGAPMNVYFEVTYLEMKHINEKIVDLTANVKKAKLLYALIGFVLSLIISLSFLNGVYGFLVSVLVGLFIYTYGAKQFITFQNFLATLQIKERFPKSYAFRFNSEYFVYERRSSPKTTYEISWSTVHSAAEFDNFYLLYIKKAGGVLVLKKTLSTQSEMSDEMFQARLNDILLEKGLL